MNADSTVTRQVCGKCGQTAAAVPGLWERIVQLEKDIKDILKDIVQLEHDVPRVYSSYLHVFKKLNVNCRRMHDAQ